VVADKAYETCLRLARQHYENFPVASRLLPKDTRHHVAAIYAFARVADDLADEGDHPPADRIARLEHWQWRLHEAAAGRVEDDGSEAAEIFTAVAATMQTCQLEARLFEDLLSAFCQDVLVQRYQTWQEVIDYCRRSANPIGRLVLRVHGYRGAEIDRLSDAVCTALQLTNFWQDLERDWVKGRLYVPLDALRASGATEDEFDRREWTSGWQAVMRELAGRTRALFDEGRPVADAVRGRLRWELRTTWLGGVRILDRLEAADYDVFERRPTLGWRDAPSLAWRMVRW
jgi:squalene synthase HpnC